MTGEQYSYFMTEILLSCYSRTKWIYVGRLIKIKELEHHRSYHSSSSGLLSYALLVLIPCRRQVRKAWPKYLHARRWSLSLYLLRQWNINVTASDLIRPNIWRFDNLNNWRTWLKCGEIFENLFYLFQLCMELQGHL